MAYRLPGDRVRLDLDGPTVEVERILSPVLHQIGLGRLQAHVVATKPDVAAQTLVRLYEHVIAEAQPVWDLADHRGAVPPTVDGMCRLPRELGLQITMGWLGTLAVETEEPESAVDAVISPGPLQREVKRRLRSVKAA